MRLGGPAVGGRGRRDAARPARATALQALHGRRTARDQQRIGLGTGLLRGRHAAETRGASRVRGGGGVRGAAHGARFVMNGERGGERGRCAVQVCCAFKWGLRAKRPVPGSAALLRTAPSTFLRCCALQLRVQYLAVGSGGLDAK